MAEKVEETVGHIESKIDTIIRDLEALKENLIELAKSSLPIVQDLEDDEASLRRSVAELKAKREEASSALAVINRQKEADLDEAAGGNLTVQIEAINARLASLQNQVKDCSDCLPECTVCLESCDPDRGKAPFSCPEGHVMCGTCEPRLDKCPMCRKTRFEVGGRFTRLRAIENMKGYKKLDGKELENLATKMAELMVEKKPLEMQKKAILAKCSKDSEQHVRTLENLDIQANRTDEELYSASEMLAAFQAYFPKLEASLSQAALDAKACLDRSLDEARRSHPMAGRQCGCGLDCSHSFKIVCGCPIKEQQACYCITHVVTLTLMYGGQFFGEMDFQLFGRTYPRAVQRFLKAAETKTSVRFLAGSVIRIIRRDIAIEGGMSHTREKISIPFTEEEKQLDELPASLIPPRPYAIVVDDTEVDGPWFGILLRPEKHQNSRVIGQVAHGLSRDFLRKMEGLPTEGVHARGSYMQGQLEPPVAIVDCHTKSAYSLSVGYGEQ